MFARETADTEPDGLMSVFLFRCCCQYLLCDCDLLSLTLNSYLDWGGEFTPGNLDRAEETHCNTCYVWVRVRAHGSGSLGEPAFSVVPRCLCPV